VGLGPRHRVKRQVDHVAQETAERLRVFRNEDGLAALNPVGDGGDLTPAEVQEIATKAEQHDPSVLDKVGGFYAEHPQLVKTLGSAALAIALAGVSRRMRA